MHHAETCTAIGYEVVAGTGLLENESDWPAALNTIEQEREKWNAFVVLHMQERPSLYWSLEGKWWVYEDQGGSLRFRKATGNRLGIRILGTVTVQERAS